MNTNRLGLSTALRRSTIAAGGIALASALAVAPASAGAVNSLETSASTTTQSTAATEESLETELQDGSLRVPVQDGFKLEQDGGGGAMLISEDGSSVPLTKTITAGSTSYSGTWKVEGGPLQSSA